MKKRPLKILNASEKEKVEKTSADEKIERLSKLIEQIEKKYGKGSVCFLGQRPRIDVDKIETDLISLNYVCGVGGLPRGRIIEFFGRESTGKTTLALHAIAAEQKRGKLCAFVDAEHAYSTSYAKSLGVDNEKLLFSQPDYAEQALAIIEDLATSGLVSIIVVDSVAALVPLAELEGNFDEQQVGLQARLMSKAMRKLTAIISKTNTCLIFINQIREKIGSYGGGETTPGGNALKFYSSLRLSLKFSNAIKKDNELLGGWIKIEAVKNKIADPYRKRLIPLYYGKGFDSKLDLVNFAKDLNLIEKSASWYEFADYRQQGLENFSQNMPQEIFEKLKQRVEEKVFAESETE